jgi:hypothetical protein
VEKALAAKDALAMKAPTIVIRRAPNLLHRPLTIGPEKDTYHTLGVEEKMALII